MKSLWAFLAGIVLSIPLTRLWVQDTLSRMEIFYPTQTCHTDVKAYLKTHHEHGIVVASGTCMDREGYVYQHIWIEYQGNVISWGLLHDKRAEFRMPIQDYYELMNVSEVKKNPATQVQLGSGQ